MIFKLAIIALLLGQTGAAPVEEAPAAEVQQVEAVEGAEALEEGAVQTTQAEGETATETAEGQAPGLFGACGTKSPWLTWGILIGVLVVFYLLMIIPQRRRQKKHKQMLEQLHRGDKIMTNGGIIGTISRVKEESFMIKTGDKSEIEVSKAVVSEKK